MMKSQKPWILDTGAYNHVTNEKGVFKELHKVSKEARVFGFDGSVVQLEGIGPVDLSCLTVTGAIASLTLSNTDYAPSSKCNLISVGRLISDGAMFSPPSLSSWNFQFGEHTFVAPYNPRARAWVLDNLSPPPEKSGKSIAKRKRNFPDIHGGSGRSISPNNSEKGSEDGQGREKRAKTDDFHTSTNEHTEPNNPSEQSVMGLLDEQILYLFQGCKTRKEMCQRAFENHKAIAAINQDIYTSIRDEFGSSRQGTSLRYEHGAQRDLWSPEEWTDWYLSWKAMQLIFVLAAPTEEAREAMKYTQDLLGAEYTQDLLGAESTPVSLDEPVTLRQHVELAQVLVDVEGQTTVLGVGLIDQELNGDGIDFDHWFTLVIGPEGVRFYNTWDGEHGLVQCVASGYSEIQQISEFQTFLDAFSLLEKRHDGGWNLALKRAYGTCFDVDLSVDGMARNMSIPPYKPHVTVFTLNNVKAEDILKFE